MQTQYDSLSGKGSSPKKGESDIVKGRQLNTDHCELNQCSKYEGSAGAHPNIYCLNRTSSAFPDNILTF